MKLAILVCGEYREFEIAVTSWDFLSNTDNEVFFSTWNISKQTHNRLNINIEEDITEVKIKKVLPNANVSILSWSDFPAITNDGEKMYLHWKNALDMMKKSGEAFTHILLIRPDLFLNNVSEDYSTWNDKFQNDRLYALEDMRVTGKNMIFAQDQFVTGTYDVMVNFIDSLEIMTRSHEQLGNHITSMGLWYEKLQMSSCIVRGICRNVDDLSFGQIISFNHEWSIKN